MDPNPPKRSKFPQRSMPSFDDEIDLDEAIGMDMGSSQMTAMGTHADLIPQPLPDVHLPSLDLPPSICLHDLDVYPQPDPQPEPEPQPEIQPVVQQEETAEPATASTETGISSDIGPSQQEKSLPIIETDMAVSPAEGDLPCDDTAVQTAGDAAVKVVAKASSRNVDKPVRGCKLIEPQVLKPGKSSRLLPGVAKRQPKKKTRQAKQATTSSETKDSAKKEDDDKAKTQEEGAEL